MYLQRNIVTRSCNLCYHGKAISISQYKRVLLALVTQHAMRRRHIAIRGLPHSTILIDVILFSKNVIEHKTVFWFSQQLLSDTFLILNSN
jgi:hypothetical protein